MLETEIKKLTAALEANTNALLDNGTRASTGQRPKRPVGEPAPPPAEVPNVQPVVAPSEVPNVQPVVAPTAVIPVVLPGPAAVVAPAVASPPEVTKDQVLRELSAVIQKMGDNGVAVTTLLSLTYGVANLSALDPAQYSSVIASARALIV